MTATGLVPISSIKEKVKKNTSTAAGDFLTFQPMYMSKDGSDLPPHGLGSLHSRVRLFGFSLPAVFIVWLRRSQSVLKPTSKTVVSCQPWFYLRLAARGTQRLTYQWRLTLEPERLKNRPPPEKIPRDGTDSRDTQAVCGFRCWASKPTPLFQRINVIAAILRARVRRAISGRIPLATNAA